jgi:hypothetical protein
LKLHGQLVTWRRGEQSAWGGGKLQEEEQNTNELTEEQQLHAVEQEQTGRAARGEATGLSRRIYWKESVGNERAKTMHISATIGLRMSVAAFGLAHAQGLKADKWNCLVAMSRDSKEREKKKRKTEGEWSSAQTRQDACTVSSAGDWL